MTNATLLLLSTTFSALQLLTKFLEQCWVERLLLVPFAEPLIIPAEYMRKMSQAITNTSIQVSCLTDEMSKADMKQAIAQADAIYIPGGNTFHLLARMYEYDLLDPIRQHVANGKPYIGR